MIASHIGNIGHPLGSDPLGCAFPPQAKSGSASQTREQLAHSSQRMLSKVLRSAAMCIALVANIACVFGGILGAVMIAQFLEHGVLSAVRRHRLQKNKSQSELRTVFYRAYWSMTLLYLMATALWVYASDRSTSKLAYGVTFLFCMQLFQLVVAVMLSSWDGVLKKVKTFGRRKWVKSLQARLFQSAAKS